MEVVLQHKIYVKQFVVMVLKLFKLNNVMMVIWLMKMDVINNV